MQDSFLSILQRIIKFICAIEHYNENWCQKGGWPDLLKLNQAQLSTVAFTETVCGHSNDSRNENWGEWIFMDDDDDDDDYENCYFHIYVWQFSNSKSDSYRTRLFYLTSNFSPSLQFLIL